MRSPLPTSDEEEADPAAPPQPLRRRRFGDDTAPGAQHVCYLRAPDEPTWPAFDAAERRNATRRGQPPPLDPVCHAPEQPPPYVQKHVHFGYDRSGRPFFREERVPLYSRLRLDPQLYNCLYPGHIESENSRQWQRGRMWYHESFYEIDVLSRSQSHTDLLAAGRRRQPGPSPKLYVNPNPDHSRRYAHDTVVWVHAGSMYWPGVVDNKSPMVRGAELMHSYRRYWRRQRWDMPALLVRMFPTCNRSVEL